MSVEHLMLRPQMAATHLDTAFAAYAKGQGIADVTAISPPIIRLYLVTHIISPLVSTVVKAFLRLLPSCQFAL